MFMAVAMVSSLIMIRIQMSGEEGARSGEGGGGITMVRERGRPPATARAPTAGHLVVVATAEPATRPLAAEFIPHQDLCLRRFHSGTDSSQSHIGRFNLATATS